jgi:hypothetical protein
VKPTSDYKVAKDQWCEISFEPLKTKGLRLQVKQQPNWAAGVHEWKVIAADEE